MRDQTAAIILAGGRGTRLNSTEVNKVTLPFNGRPMIDYGVDLMNQLASQIVVVVGAFEDSVREVLKQYSDVRFAKQDEQLGTGHAAQIGFKELSENPPKQVLVGYGDHLMFYEPGRVQEMIDRHIREQAAISFVTTIHEQPDELAWGRVERDDAGDVMDIVEHKDADEKQRAITELNAGLYCFDYAFLEEFLPQIHASAVTGEYYLTDLVTIACGRQMKVLAVPFPFEEVGIGINSPTELEDSQELYTSSHTL